MKNWKRLASGKYVDLNNIALSDIDIVDIEQSLNHTYRFSGHFKDRKPLTVAQHTLLTMNLSDILFGDEKTRHLCKIHDYPEAYYGDISTPLKKMMGDHYKLFAQPIDKVVFQSFWPVHWGQPDEYLRLACKVCDMLSLDIERRMMWKDQTGKDKWPTPPNNPFKMGDKEELFNEVASIEYIKLGELT